MPGFTPLLRSRITTGSTADRRSLVSILACGLCLGLALSDAPVSAEGWLGKRVVKKPEPAVAAAPQGFAGTIRRMMNEAQAAADRGDLAAARMSAARACKLAVACRASLADAPDCSPEQTAELLRKFSDQPASQAAAAAPPSQPSPGIAHLTPLLDVPATESLPLVPPAPAPALPVVDAVHRPAPTAIVPKQPVRKAIAAVPQKLPDFPVESQVPQPVAKPKPQQVVRSGSADPWQTPGNHRVPSQPQNFLVMRSDWLAGDADVEELLEDLDDATESSAPVRRPVASRRKSVEDFENVAEDEPEVTTAIGRSQAAQWEFDLNAVESDASWDSQPILESNPAPRHAAGDVPESTAAMENSRHEERLPIGVWSGGAPAVGASSQVANVVSRSKFLDPSISAALGNSGRSSGADVPRVIETDFRTPSPVPALTPPDESVLTVSSDSIQPLQENRHATREASEARPSQPVGPAVTYREDPALDWLPAAEPAAVIRSQTPTWFQTLWHQGRASRVNQFAAGGLGLVLCGLTLFGLSFRRA